MTTLRLYDGGGHRNLLLENFAAGSLAVGSNQHLIIDGDEAMILDPGGHKIYSKVLSAAFSELGRARITKIFLSHQDPDVVAAINGWLMTTDAVAYASKLWHRFIPHFGVDQLVQDRLLPIPDEGLRLPLGQSELWILPAHFLHSCGNFHVYDPVAKVLYTGDLGASMNEDRAFVEDFAAHALAIQGFHQRYMQSNRALRAWVQMARQLEVEILAPQHGAMLRGREVIEQFYRWCEALPCGIDLMEGCYQLPPPRAAS